MEGNNKGLTWFLLLLLKQKKKVGRMGKAEGEGKDQEEVLIQASDGSKAH